MPVPAPVTLAGQQAAVVAQVAVAVALASRFFAWAPTAVAARWPALSECPPGAAPALAARLLAASALPLLAGVAALGNARFMGPGINPIAVPMTSSVLARYLSNTLEQYVLHAAAVAGLAAWGRCAHAAAAAAWFVAARAAFFAGYGLHPSGIWRGLGFAATAYPTAVALGYCVWRLATEGPLPQ